MAADLKNYLATRPELIRAWRDFSDETWSRANVYFNERNVAELGHRYPRREFSNDSVYICVRYIFWRVLPSVSWGRGRFEPTVKFRATVLRWYSDEPQPGVIEVSIRDRSGADHRVIEKWYRFVSDVDPESSYPIPIWVEAEVVNDLGDAIEVVLPWGSETVDGKESLILSLDDIVNLDEPRRT